MMEYTKLLRSHKLSSVTVRAAVYYLTRARGNSFDTLQRKCKIKSSENAFF